MHAEFLSEIPIHMNIGVEKADIVPLNQKQTSDWIDQPLEKFLILILNLF